MTLLGVGYMIKYLAATVFAFVCTLAASAEFSIIRSYVHPVLIGKDTSVSGVKNILSSGSGIAVAPGYVLTAAHVVPQAIGSTLYLKTDTLHTAKVVKIDRERDLALLSTKVACPCTPIAKKVPSVDDEVYTVGFPLYLLYGTQVVTSGHVQGTYQGDTVSTTHTAPGGSGGGMYVKEDGEYRLAGIAIAIASTPIGPRALHLDQEQNWLMFSVPMPAIRDFLKGTPVTLK